MAGGTKMPKEAKKSTPTNKRKAVGIKSTRRSARATRYRSDLRDEDFRNPITISDNEGLDGEVSSVTKDTSIIEYDDKKSTTLKYVKMEVQDEKGGKKRKTEWVCVYNYHILMLDVRHSG